MIPQEALNHFKEHLCKHCCEWNKSLRHCNTCPADTAKKALEKQKWNKTSEVKPTEEKQYLCCSIYTNRPHFKVLGWSNNLYEVDNYDFEFNKGESGFYRCDSEWGYYEDDCDYWKEIDWSEDDDE